MTEHIRAKCQICGAEGVDSILHRKGCEGSTPSNPLIMLERWDDDKPGPRLGEDVPANLEDIVPLEWTDDDDD